MRALAPEGMFVARESLFRDSLEQASHNNL